MQTTFASVQVTSFSNVGDSYRQEFALMDCVKVKDYTFGGNNFILFQPFQKGSALQGKNVFHKSKSFFRI